MESPGVTILLIETDRVLRDLITLALQRLESPHGKFRVVQAAEAAQALALCQSEKPQVIVLELLLPDMNGLELLQRLRGDGLLENTQVIFLSALGYREIVQQAVEAGAVDFLVKPFEVERLAGRVRVLAGRARGLSSPGSAT